MSNVIVNSLSAVYPTPEKRAKLISLIVKFFPRRLFSHFRIEQNKYSQETLFLRKDISVPSPIEVPKNCEMGLVDEEVLKDMIAHDEGLDEEVYRRRQARGDIAYYQKVDGELVSYNWISLSLCGVYIGFAKGVNFYSLSEKQAFTYDFYTYKRFRKKGFGSRTKQYLLVDLYTKGVREMFSCVEPSNRNSLKIHIAFSYQLEAIVTNYRIMGWSYTYWSGAKRLAACREWLRDY